MKKALVAIACVLGAGLTTSAMASGHVNWSLNIGTPIYTPPPVVYAPPQPVYVQPQPVYVQPPPVAYGPVYYYDAYGRPYYFEHGRRYYYHGHHHGWR